VRKERRGRKSDPRKACTKAIPASEGRRKKKKPAQPVVMRLRERTEKSCEVRSKRGEGEERGGGGGVCGGHLTDKKRFLMTKGRCSGKTRNGFAGGNKKALVSDAKQAGGIHRVPKSSGGTKIFPACAGPDY